MLTVAYMTSRPNPRFEWFTASLRRQVLESGWQLTDVNLVVVDFYADDPGRCSYINDRANGFKITLTPPKPTVWQGKYRLTKRDYFAASNARNTAFCFAPDGYIAYVDDLSVLMPKWFSRVREAIKHARVTCGAYKKATKLVVEDGIAVSWDEEKIDSRWNFGRDDQPVPITGGALYGCSLVLPTDFVLKVNGWDEDCDRMGGEDWVFGTMLEKWGCPLVYDRSMLTFESDEAHSEGPVFNRIDKGKSPNDASHRMLRWVTKEGRRQAPNYFGIAGIGGLRRRILRGEDFPIAQNPQHCWYDGQALTEM